MPQFLIVADRAEWLRMGPGGLWTTSRGGKFWDRASAVAFLVRNA
jgi:hypothetical protein